MIRISIGLRQAARSILALLLIAVACQVVQRAPAAEPGETAPKIAEFRVGLDSHYKLGTWTPIVVEVSGAGSAAGLHVEVSALDSDGVTTKASAPFTQATADGRSSAVVYTQVGRVGSPITVSLADERQTLDERILQPKARAGSSPTIAPIAATAQVVLSLGAKRRGIAEAIPNRTGGTNQVGRRLIEISDIKDLPDQWYGYDAVDVMLIAVDDGAFIRGLAGDAAKFSALVRWVELGGRLVILCGGENAQSMLGPGGALEPLSPGKFAEVVRLTDPGAFEQFAASTAPIGAAPVQVPRLTDIVGNIDAYAGRRPTDLPLVIRSPRGFGEIAFSGVEFHQPPLSEWPGRVAFIQALVRPYLPDTGVAESSQQLSTSGFNDLSGALRQQLGKTFTGVAPIGFPIVTGLVIAYLLVLGPFDYLLVNRWLRRPLAAWISFPLIVAAFSTLAIAAGNWSRGSSNPRLNQLALVDVDTVTEQVRGTLWTVLYSPDARRFDLGVNVHSPGMDPSAPVEKLFSWWGLPGVGIGGMQTGGADWEIVPIGYEYGPDLRSLTGVPVLTSATKSLSARWTAKSSNTFEAQLSDTEGLVVGTIQSQLEVPLQNARLLYGSWAYKLGTLNPGEQVEVSEALSPRKAKTIVTRDALSGGNSNVAPVEGRVFSAESASPLNILNLMMFYETAGGYGFAHLPNRYQSYCDMSRQLELGRAVLVAESAENASPVVDDATGEPVGKPDANNSHTVFRFILPVQRPSAQ